MINTTAVRYILSTKCKFDILYSSDTGTAKKYIALGRFYSNIPW